jgi:aspartate/methionine/tyrosine aminotransferase
VAFPLFLSKLLIRSGVAHWLPTVQRRTGGAGAFLGYYSDRVLSAPSAELDAVAACLEPPAPDTLDLALGAPRFDFVPDAALLSDRRSLPPSWGLPELRGAVAEKLHADSGLVVHPDREVLITLGAGGAFNLVLDAFLNPGDRVVLFDPTSPLYRWALKQRRAYVRWLPSWTEAGRLRFDPSRLPQVMRGARLMVLASPANPSGGVLAAEDLERIAWWAERHDVLLFNDQVFERFSYEAPAASIAMQPKAKARTLTVGSVSKGHGMASARVGWLAGHRHLVRPAAVTAALQAALVPALSQQVALAALREPEDRFAALSVEFDARRRYAFERLRALGLSPVWPAGAFFLWLPVRELGMDGRTFAGRLFAQKAVLVWPGEHFGPSGTDYVRLSYAAEDGRFREGLSRLAELVRELRAMPTGTPARRAA